MLSMHLILYCPLLLQYFPAPGSFLMSQLFTSGSQSIGASASVFSMDIQGWFPLELTGLISLQSKGLSGIFSSTVIHKHQFFSTQPSLWSNSHIHTQRPETHSFHYTDLCQESDISVFNMLFKLIIAFLPRSKCLLISWLQSFSAVILEPKKIKSVTASNFSPSICHEGMVPDAMILVFWMLSFKPAFSIYFTLIKRLFSSLLSAIRVVSSAYLKLLIFLQAILIPAYNSFSPAFCIMYSAYKLNKQGDNIQPCHTPFPILNQSVVPCKILTVGSSFPYRFLRR